MNRDLGTEPRPFLRARWESLVLLNWACPAPLLEPLVPRGTALDPWDGAQLVSLVGFLFRDTRVRGAAIPFHRHFEEVNLRFYVRRDVAGESRRAVVFIRELVPRRAVAALARWLYDEPYLAVPMGHAVDLDPETGGTATYSWRYRGRPFELSAEATGPARSLEAGTEAEFVTEHYWGYTRMRDGGTNEYRVAHDPWRVWNASAHRFSGPAASLYGDDFADVLAAEPRSAYVAVGGPVVVHAGRRLPD